MEGAFFVAPDAVCAGLLRGECCMHGDRGGVSGAYGVLSYGVKEPKGQGLDWQGHWYNALARGNSGWSDRSRHRMRVRR